MVLQGEPNVGANEDDEADNVGGPSTCTVREAANKCRCQALKDLYYLSVHLPMHALTQVLVFVSYHVSCNGQIDLGYANVQIRGNCVEGGKIDV